MRSKLKSERERLISGGYVWGLLNGRKPQILGGETSRDRRLGKITRRVHPDEGKTGSGKSGELRGRSDYVGSVQEPQPQQHPPASDSRTEDQEISDQRPGGRHF